MNDSAVYSVATIQKINNNNSIVCRLYIKISKRAPKGGKRPPLSFEERRCFFLQRSGSDALLKGAVAHLCKH